MTTNPERMGRPQMESDAAGRRLPILIEVPRVGTMHGRVGSRGRTQGPRRRRLRKEVRVAGMTLLSVVPLCLLILTLGGPRPNPRFPRLERVSFATHPDSRASHRTEAILGLESTATESTPLDDHATQLRPIATVQFPGYLLPADGSEDLDHAGR